MVLVGDGIDDFGFGVEVEFNCVEQIALSEFDFRLVLGNFLRIVLVLLCPRVRVVAVV